VLSGFLITGILLDAKGHSHYFRNFYLRRVLRIMPLYYTLVVVRLVVLPVIGRPPGWVAASKAVAALVFLTNFWQTITPEADRPDVLLSPTWSLCIEEQFYLVWPFLAANLSSRWLLRVSAGLVLLAPAIRSALVLGGADPWAAYSLPFCRMDALSVGAALAVLARRPAGLAGLVRAARVVLVLAGCATVAVIVAQGSTSDLEKPMAAVGYTLIDLACGSLLVLAAAGRGSFRWLCETWPLRAAGKYSYAAYLLHGPIGLIVGYYALVRSNALAPVRSALASTGSDLPLFLLSVVLIIAATFASARLSWVLIERPFLRLKRRFPD
jgi:peptidoglycan/LPS O-acetylase OafA/YrhL